MRKLSILQLRYRAPMGGICFVNLKSMLHLYLPGYGTDLKIVQFRSGMLGTTISLPTAPHMDNVQYRLLSTTMSHYDSKSNL